APRYVRVIVAWLRVSGPGAHAGGMTSAVGSLTVTSASQIRRNTIFLALCLVTLSGVIQLAVAVATITLVLVTGIESILGLGPAIFLTAGALAALPAGRLMDRFGRVPVIAGGFVTGAVGCALTA